jgi:hypothetical protein
MRRCALASPPTTVTAMAALTIDNPIRFIPVLLQERDSTSSRADATRRACKDRRRITKRKMRSIAA